MKRHLVILLVVTAVVRGALFISYPLGGKDDNQAAQRSMIAELLHGNLMIGNVRYQTGYPLMIAPVVAASKLFGAADERIVLLVQVVLSSVIPFLIYDILRTRRSPREAFVVALVVLLDPFGLEWAHFWLPEWLIALLVVLALWLVHRAILRGHHLGLIALAGIALGAATVARMNVAPLAVVLGGAFLILPATVWRQRLRMFVTLGVSSGLIVVAYMVGIHYPSTGTWSPSCITGTNLVESALDKRVPLTADNGTATRHLLELLTLKPERELLFLEDSYPLWRIPGPWMTPEEQARFFSQPYGTRATHLTTGYPGDLVYYMGPCPSDELLRAVSNEAVLAHPVQWLIGTGVALGRIVVHHSHYDHLSLPRYDTLKIEDDVLPGGFASVTDRIHFTGQRVWLPGIWLFSTIFDALNLTKWLTAPALIWVLWSKDWFYRVGALLLLVCLIFIAVFDSSAEPRLYAAVYPLYTFLIGGFVFAAVRWIAGRTNRNRQEG